MIVLTVRVFNEADRNLTESVTQGNLTICEALVDTNEEGEASGANLIEQQFHQALVVAKHEPSYTSINFSC
jgi:hypothetical protein